MAVGVGNCIWMAVSTARQLGGPPSSGLGNKAPAAMAHGTLRHHCIYGHTRGWWPMRCGGRGAATLLLVNHTTGDETRFQTFGKCAGATNVAGRSTLQICETSTDYHAAEALAFLRAPPALPLPLLVATPSSTLPLPLPSPPAAVSATGTGRTRCGSNT